MLPKTWRQGGIKGFKSGCFLNSLPISMAIDKMFIQYVNISIQISRLKRGVKALRPRFESL